MKYIINSKDDAHERATQGTNGDYLEISFVEAKLLLDSEDKTQDEVNNMVEKIDDTLKALVKVEGTIENNNDKVDVKLPNTGVVVGGSMVVALGIGLTLAGAKIIKKRKED